MGFSLNPCVLFSYELEPMGSDLFGVYLHLQHTQSCLYSDVLYSYEPEPTGGSESLTFLGFICICGAQSWL